MISKGSIQLVKCCKVCGKEISKEEYEGNEGMCSDCYYEYYQQLDNGLDEELLQNEGS